MPGYNMNGFKWIKRGRGSASKQYKQCNDLHQWQDSTDYTHY